MSRVGGSSDPMTETGACNNFMKQLIKHFILFFWSVMRYDDRPKILFYHDIGTKYTGMGTPSDVFWAHMKILSESSCGFRHRVGLDDGFRGIWDHRERLKALIVAGLRVDVSIAIDLIGLPQHLTWDEIRQLESDYGVHFLCHTWSHQTLIGNMLWDRAKREMDDDNHVTYQWYERELRASRKEIERHLGHDVRELCLPVGYFNDEIIGLCHEAGYERIYSSIPGNIEGTSCLARWQGYVVPRCLCQFLSPREFNWVLNGGMLPLASRYFMMYYIKDPQ